MKGIVIHTALFDPFAPGSMFRVKKDKSEYALRHYVINVKARRTADPALHQSFVLCATPPGQDKTNEFDLDMYHTMYDQDRILTIDDLEVPYHPTLQPFVENWTTIDEYRPTPDRAGVVVTDQISRQFLVEHHETAMYEDFAYLFNGGKVEAVLTVEPRPFGVEIPGRFILASKLYGGDWQTFYHLKEPKRFKCNVVG